LLQVTSANDSAMIAETMIDHVLN